MLRLRHYCFALIALFHPDMIVAKRPGKRLARRACCVVLFVLPSCLPHQQSFAAGVPQAPGAPGDVVEEAEKSIRKAQSTLSQYNGVFGTHL